MTFRAHFLSYNLALAIMQKGWFYDILCAPCSPHLALRGRTSSLMSSGVSGSRLMPSTGVRAWSGEVRWCRGYQVVRAVWLKMKPIILHGCPGCGAKVNLTARADLEPHSSPAATCSRFRTG